jgi:CRISPR-associated protein Csx3
MGGHYLAKKTGETGGVTNVAIGFGEPADNTVVVPDAVAALSGLKLGGGRGIHFSGPASVPAAMALAHGVAHLYGYVACWDPKLGGYVVVISHDAAMRPGMLIRPGNP